MANQVQVEDTKLKLKSQNSTSFLDIELQGTCITFALYVIELLSGDI